MLDCRNCGGSNRNQFMPCPRCGLFDHDEMNTMLGHLQAGGATQAEQTAVQTEENNYLGQPGTTG